MAYTAEILTSSIVVVGDFNPAIFSPDWFARNNLIGEGDASSAREGSNSRKSIVSHQVTSFETDWFVLQVLERQFSLTSKGVLSPAFKDLAVGTFQLVSHTPVTAVGLNFVGHYKISTQELHHKVGDEFAPKDIWNTLYPGEYAGLQQLTILFQQGSRDNTIDTKDEKRITLQPSQNLKFGVSLSINNHHDVMTMASDELTPAERVAMIIDQLWEDEWSDAVSTFDKILTQAETV